AIDDEARSMVHAGADEQRLRETARRHGMRSLRQDGQRWVTQGVSTREELARVTRDTRRRSRNVAMPSYQYDAADAAGQIERGTIEAETARSARQLLRARGLLPLSLRSTRHAGNPGRSLSGSRLRDTELGWLTRQLAGLLEAGLTLEQALSVGLEQAERRHVAQVLA